MENIRDGKSFCTRNVKGIQHGENIFLMSASFAVPEEGLEHQVPMPPVEGPEGVPSEYELRLKVASLIPERIRDVFIRERPVELRPIDPVNPFAPVKKEPHRFHWMKAQSRLPDDPLLHMCILAFASDYALMSTAMLPHGVSYMQNNMQAASLDHAMWFHRDFRIDEWLLYDMDAPNASASRGMNFGRIILRNLVEPALIVFGRVDRRFEGDQHRRQARIFRRHSNFGCERMGDRSVRFRPANFLELFKLFLLSSTLSMTTVGLMVMG